jgi:hypothetical protein
VSHYGLAIYMEKYLKAIKKNYGNSNISRCKKYIIFKKFSKRNHNGSRYYYNPSITNLKIRRHKPKKYHLFKNPHIKIDLLLLLLLPRGP